MNPLPISTYEDKDAVDKSIARLSMLANVSVGWPNYFGALLESDDPCCAVGAACALLERGHLTSSTQTLVMRLCGYLPVRKRAFAYFMNRHEYEVARKVLEIPSVTESLSAIDCMMAELQRNFSRLAEAHVVAYLNTANIEHLNKVHDAADELGGWKLAVPVLVNHILINPQEVAWPMRLAKHLIDADRYDLLDKVYEAMSSAGLFPLVCIYLQAQVSKNRGEIDLSVKLLSKVETSSLPDVLDRAISALTSELLEKLGRYRDSYDCLVRLKSKSRTQSFDPRKLAKLAMAQSALPSVELGPDKNLNYYIMLGFPRSGTTLLENILQSHPSIETFEEIPAFRSIGQVIHDLRRSRQHWTPETASLSRSRYYAEIDRHKKKSGAMVFVEKMPIMTVRATFLKKLFPEKRYIFSIRHPYDVVLSCFRQNFLPNMAMDSFTTVADTCWMYDFAMNEWFSNFSLTDHRVCYVKYDDLVRDMKNTVQRALAFLNVDWNDEMLAFASKADVRRSKTPSYKMVRKGIDIGVQSSWRNYKFLFEKDETRCLDKWVRHFGYDL